MTLALLVLLAQLTSSHGSSGAVGAATSAGGLSWTVPKAWTTVPGSSMRVATYRTASAPGDKEGGEIAVFYFGQGQGGGVDANVDRWFAQVTAEPGSKKNSSSKMKVGDIPVTICAAEGTYTGGMGMGAASTGPKTGFALEGAIAEGPRGSVFFKLTGPKKTVAKEKAAFDALVKSLKSAP
ncbi:MAG: hypothetical protein ACHQPI_00355 [Thermoanaerobaculia bacterium]